MAQLIEISPNQPLDQIDPRFSPVAPEAQLQRPPDIDARRGAPKYVRMMVGAAPTKEARLQAIQQFFPDAVADVEDPDNFVFTDPETGKPTLYNPSGLDMGDLASLGRETAQGAIGGLGAVAGAVGGTAAMGPGPGTAVGAVVGAGLGTAAGEEVSNLAYRAMGGPDPRTLTQRSTQTAGIAGQGAVGEMGGALLGKFGTAAVKYAFRGRGGVPAMQQQMQNFAVAGTQPTAGQATGNAALQMFESLLSRSPGGMVQFRRAAQQAMKDMKGAVETRVTQLSRGADVSPESVGITVREGLGPAGFVKRFKDAGKAKFDAIPIKPDQSVAPSNTIKYLMTKTTPIAGAEETSSGALLKNTVLQDTLARLQKDMAKGGGALPYQALKDLRTAIGEIIADPKVLEDVGTQQLRGLYGALTADMKAAASAAGPAALKAFEEANAFWKAGAEKLEKVIGPLLKRSEIKVEQAFTVLEQGGKEGAAYLRQLKSSLSPEEWDIVGAAVLNRLGRAKAGQQDAAGDLFSADTFLTNWNNLADEAKTAFFGSGRIRSDLDKIAGVAATLRESGRVFANPPNTAGSLVGQTAIVAGSGAVPAAIMTGNMETAAFIGGTLALSAVAANAAAKLLTNPKFINWLARSTELKPTGMAAHLGRLTAIGTNADPETRDAINQYLSLLAGGEK